MGLVNIEGLYEFFTDDNVAQEFSIVIISQFIFMTVGWLLTFPIWSLARGNPTPVEPPDLTALQDFILSDQSAAINTGIGVGYFIFGTLAWIGLAQLGEPESKR